MSLIYSVEDDAGIRELINYALTGAGFEVASFDAAESLFAAMEDRLPDMAILDIMLPNMDGMDALKTIRQKYKQADIKVIMLTAKASEINKISGLDGGADDYITKPFSVLELTARVRAHLRNRISTERKTDGRIEIGGISLNESARSVISAGKPVALTFKEFELLRTLMKSPGAVVGRETLLKEIWGYEYFGQSRTVDIHIKNLRAKLGANGGHIAGVRGVGYIFKLQTDVKDVVASRTK